MADAKPRKSKKKSKASVGSKDAFAGYGSSESIKIDSGVLTPEMIEQAAERAREEFGKPYIPMVSFKNFKRLEFMVKCGFVRVNPNGVVDEAAIQYYWYQFGKTHPELLVQFELENLTT